MGPGNLDLSRPQSCHIFSVTLTVTRVSIAPYEELAQLTPAPASLPTDLPLPDPSRPPHATRDHGWRHSSKAPTKRQWCSGKESTEQAHKARRCARYIYLVRRAYTCLLTRPASPSQPPPKDLEEFVNQLLSEPEREGKFEVEKDETIFVPGKDRSSLTSVRVSTADQINNDNDDAIEAELSAANTVRKSATSCSIEPAAFTKTTANSAPQKSKKQSQAADDKVPALEGQTSERTQRAKANATRIKARKALKAKLEAAAKAHTVHYDSDDVIDKYDPYFKIGCQRRMVFTSDTVPADQQYALLPPEHCTAADKEYPSAVEKFLEWWKKRDKTQRHFVLKMGQPVRRYGRSSTLGAKLKAAWDPHFKTRLSSSHITIETEISTKFVKTGYYDHYIDGILEFKMPEKLGKLLTVTLADGPIDILEQANQVDFYKPPVDIEAEWLAKERGSDFHEHVLSLADPTWRDNLTLAAQKKYVPSLEQVKKAKAIFNEQKISLVDKQKDHVDSALKKAKDFINKIRWSERSKELAQGGSSEKLLVVENLTTAKAPNHDLAVNIRNPLRTPGPVHNPNVPAGRSVSSLKATGTHPGSARLVQSESTMDQASLVDGSAGPYYQQLFPADHGWSLPASATHNQTVPSGQNALDPSPNRRNTCEAVEPQTGHQLLTYGNGDGSGISTPLPAHGRGPNLDYFDLSAFRSGSGYADKTPV